MTITSRSGRSGKVYTREVVIASGQSLSTACDLGADELIGFVMPSAWTAANITFAASFDNGTTYGVVKDAADSEVSVTMTSYVANEVRLLSPVSTQALYNFKLRSGTSSVPVNQAAARTITLILKERN